MKNGLRSLTLPILPALLLTVATRLSAQPAMSELLKAPPDMTFKVEPVSGTCPTTVKFWTSSREFEGGIEHTVIADTLAIANPAKLVASGKTFAEYQALLKKDYSTCVGIARYQGHPDVYPYQFRFADGNVYFQVELRANTSDIATAFSQQAILASRPYVRWAVSD